jgi:hypothetical protein
MILQGYTEDQLNECIRVYEDLNVWQISGDRSMILFLEDMGDD